MRNKIAFTLIELLVVIAIIAVLAAIESLLSAVVAEMNRFSTRKLRVSDPKVAATPVSGVFRTGQVDAFVAAIRSYGLADVGRVDDQQGAGGDDHGAGGKRIQRCSFGQGAGCFAGRGT